MTHPSKRKGNDFERELVGNAKMSGLEAKRAYASNGESLGMHAEVDLVVAGKTIQAKRRKALPAYLQCEHTDAVVFRCDRGETLVLIDWWEYLNLVKGCEANGGAQTNGGLVDHGNHQHAGSSEAPTIQNGHAEQN